MTPTPPPPTRVVVEIDDERREYNGRVAAIIAKLLEPKYRQLIEMDGPVHVTLDCKGKTSVVPRVTVG